MDNRANSGILTISMIASILIAGASSSVLLDSSDDLSENAKQIIDDVINEITTYLKIEDALGKYYTNNGVRQVERIVLLVKEFIQSNINLSEITIKIYNNNNVILLKYSGLAVEADSSTIFENKVWAETNNEFSLIVILDKDRSIIDYNIMNDDTVFMAIKLPEQLAMDNSDSITISIIPSNGITSSITLETPSFFISDLISFGDV